MKKLLLKKQNSKKAASTRITNDTVAEHREQVIAGGRRFKYPMQYARHRLVMTTVIITVTALVLVTLIGWWQLYPAQNTSTFFYRVTRVLPLPVAQVDGYPVKYSDYLMYYNGSAHWLRKSEQIDLGSKDGKRQDDYIKRKSMDIAITSAYANKLASELAINVSTDRINGVVDEARNTSTGRISQETYDASALSTIGWDVGEYRQEIKSRLTMQDVSFEIDAAAKDKKASAAKLMAGGELDFDVIARTIGGNDKTRPVVATSGLVPLTNADGGLSQAAAKLKIGAVSEPIRTTAGDGYYFVKLIDKNKTQINYSYLHIPLSEFNARILKLKSDNKIQEYISINTSEQNEVSK